ncbi:hypothetical protein BD779DRAFT_1530908 [Infundibulicybe gibba]|nr:hypothetical protein BD779DRAFT_1530908 [Infundibulicybe gibba]
MPSLLSLPNELITKIADQSETCKSFRGTCKRIDLLVSPQVLFRLVIDINKESIDRSISQLEALASRSIRTAEFVRIVDIRSLAPLTPVFHYANGFRTITFQQQEPKALWAYDKMRELLPAALSTLTGHQQNQTFVIAVIERHRAL